MTKETKVILLMIVALFLLIFLIRSIPVVFTLVFNPLRLLLLMAIAGILFYLVRKWLNEEDQNHHDDLV